MVKSDGVASTEDRTERPILVDFIPLVVFLVPCLLICLSCATPFPYENLEKGMTADTVRERFGEPEAMTRTCWSYKHEEPNLGMLIVMAPWGPIGPAFLVMLGLPWNSVWVKTNMVLVDFQEEKLVGWEVHAPGSALPESYDDSDLHMGDERFSRPPHMRIGTYTGDADVPE